jgi:alanyl-tRNA synthetase
MTSSEIRQKFITFLQERGHTLVPPSSLVPEGDVSVLFTVAGMQQFKDYYTSPELSSSPRVCSVQPVVRTVDIEEVGDNRHLTLFEMLGFFSFGYRAGESQDEKSATPYFKEVAIKQAYDFYFKELGLSMDRSYVTVYEGNDKVAKDEESAGIWKKLGVPEDKIRYEGDDNFWALGPGGPCGPTTEIYVDDIEVGNVVFNQYFMEMDGSLRPLDYMGVDTGLGLERIAVVTQGKKEVFETDLFAPILELIQSLADNDKFQDKSARVIADHLKASMFLIADGVRPSNKAQGYIVRRLIRRSAVNAQMIGIDFQELGQIVAKIHELYSPDYDRLNAEYGLINLVLSEELQKFNKTLQMGLKEFEKAKQGGGNDIPAETAFKLFDTFGFPIELTQELAEKEGLAVDKAAFDERFKAHQETSRSGSDQVFKGGLADHEPTTIRHHTAHHLLLAALRKVLGEHVFQRGSNVTGERLRIDFSHGDKVTPEQLAQVEAIVNEAIAEDLEVKREEMPKAEAEKLGALAEFGAKYGETVTVYTILNKDGSVFSREFCGGPHVIRTSEIGVFSVLKEEASSSGVRRIKAKSELR